jgi:hypothetical protein
MLCVYQQEQVMEVAIAEREQMRGGKVRGGMLAAHLKWLTEHHESDIPRFWDVLPNDVRRAVAGMVLPVNWYEFSHLVHIDGAIAKMYGDDTLRELGKYSARVNLTGVYKVFTRTSIHDFFENSAKLHPRFQDFGNAHYEQTGPTSGKMVMRDYPSFSPVFCRSAVGFYEEAVRIHGAAFVKVTEPQCQCRGNEACVFEIRWK